MTEKVTRLATTSRILVLGFQLFFNILVPDHIPEGAFRSPQNANETKPFDAVTNFLLGGLVRWDAEYFLHISEHGYTYDNTLAFYPLFPGVLGVLTRFVLYLISFISFRYTAIILSTSINVYIFQKAANCLYDLTQKVFGDATLAWNAVVLFCFNPASIFFTAPYSECMFCWLSFSLMLECLQRKNALKAVTSLGLSMICRSNGLINIGFPIYFVFREIFLKKNLFKLFKLFFITIPALVPLLVYNMYVRQIFCFQNEIKMPISIFNYGKEHGYALAGDSYSPWCDQEIPFFYSYVQKRYWDVGFLNYYQIKQIPNFLLAGPVICLMLFKSLSYLRRCSSTFKEKGFIITLKTLKSFPFVLHGLFLTIFCLFFVHIQVSTRLIASSTPCLYWFGADYLPKNFEGVSLSFPNIKSRRAFIVYWFGGYFLIGVILFSNFYPWT